MTTEENTDRHDINPDNALGLDERKMLMAICGPQPRLEYPTEPLSMSNGCTVEKYVIPEADRKTVLERLYPFTDRPELDSEMVDIHTGARFRVGDYLAIREGSLNFLAAPRYAEAGGTVLDWIPPVPDEDDEQEDEESESDEDEGD